MLIYGKSYTHNKLKIMLEQHPAMPIMRVELSYWLSLMVSFSDQENSY